MWVDLSALRSATELAPPGSSDERRRNETCKKRGGTECQVIWEGCGMKEVRKEVLDRENLALDVAGQNS